MPLETEVGENTLAAQPFFREIGYASCWEDPAVLRAALSICRGDRVLSVASGGCNVLSLLLDDPASIFCVDLNPHQLALLRLKMAAIRHLEYPALLELMGVRASQRRLAILETLLAALTPADRSYWALQGGKVKAGLHRSGRTDRYLMAFGAFLRALYGRRKVEHLFSFSNVEAQADFYRNHWDGWLWRAFFEVFFHRHVMSRAKDPSHFRYVEPHSFGRRIHGRVERLFTCGLLRENYFLALILLGHYHTEAAVPPYLLPDNLITVRERLDRIELFEGSLSAALTQHATEGFDAFNLSNLYDWLSDEARTESMEQVCRAACDGARWCYWSTLEPRRPPSVAGLLSNSEQARALADADRFPYVGFEMGRIARP